MPLPSAAKRNLLPQELAVNHGDDHLSLNFEICDVVSIFVSVLADVVFVDARC